MAVCKGGNYPLGKWNPKSKSAENFMKHYGTGFRFHDLGAGSLNRAFGFRNPLCPFPVCLFQRDLLFNRCRFVAAVQSLCCVPQVCFCVAAHKCSLAIWLAALRAIPQAVFVVLNLLYILVSKVLSSPFIKFKVLYSLDRYESPH